LIALLRRWRNVKRGTTLSTVLFFEKLLYTPCKRFGIFL
jgi:hypothetical protein